MMKKISFWRNFLCGVVSLFDWSPDYRSYEERFGKDEELLASDWQKTGDDVRCAISKIDRRLKK